MGTSWGCAALRHDHADLKRKNSSRSGSYLCGTPGKITTQKKKTLGHKSQKLQENGIVGGKE